MSKQLIYYKCTTCERLYNKDQLEQHFRRNDGVAGHGSFEIVVEECKCSKLEKHFSKDGDIYRCAYCDTAYQAYPKMESNGLEEFGR
jgi:hypothetical protein